jgi:hypothetical protein
MKKSETLVDPLALQRVDGTPAAGSGQQLEVAATGYRDRALALSVSGGRTRDRHHTITGVTSMPVFRSGDRPQKSGKQKVLLRHRNEVLPV